MDKLDCEIMKCRRELYALGAKDGERVSETPHVISTLVKAIDDAPNKHTMKKEILNLLIEIYTKYFASYMTNIDLKYFGKDYDQYNLVIYDPENPYKLLIDIESGNAATGDFSDLKASLTINSSLKKFTSWPIYSAPSHKVPERKDPDDDVNDEDNVWFATIAELINVIKEHTFEGRAFQHLIQTHTTKR